MAMNTTTPLLSVVVPIGSRKGDISQLAEWVPLAAALEIEVILVHDFQDLQTKLALNNFMGKNNSAKVKFLEGEFRSPGKARNFGIQQASGKWICFWDSDDHPNVTKFLNMVNQAELASANVCVGNFEKLNLVTGKVSKKRFSKNRLLLEMEIAKDPGIWRFAFDKNSIEDIKFENFRMGEDQSFLAEALFRCKYVHINDDFVYRYFVGSDLQLTNQKNAVREVWYFLAFCEKQKSMKLMSRFYLFIYTKQVLSLSLIQHELGLVKALSKIVSFSGLRIYYTLMFMTFLFITMFRNLRLRVRND
jgi:glycosyltransferase involved in cell wall biosynthesis